MIVAYTRPEGYFGASLGGFALDRDRYETEDTPDCEANSRYSDI